MSKRPETISYFENFDALRFISALAVLLMHNYNNFNWEYYSEHPYVYRGLSFLTRNGFVGVNFFFVLSGFLITYLIIKEINKEKSFNYGNFIMRRILRIWPVYFIVLMIAFLHKGQWNGIEYYASFLSNIEVIFRNSEQTGIQFPMWSVSIEEQFYLVVPFIIFSLKIKSKQGFILLYGLLILVSMIYQSINYQDINKLRYSTMSCVTDLSIGGILGALSFYSMNTVRYFENLSKWSILIVHIIGVSYILLRVYFYDFSVVLITEHLILALYFGFILMEQTYSRHSILKLKRFKVISKWGKYTYGFYLYHMIILIAVHHYWQYFNLYDNVLIDTGAKLAASIVLTLTISKLSFKYIEAPFLKLKNKFS